MPKPTTAELLLKYTMDKHLAELARMPAAVAISASIEDQKETKAIEHQHQILPQAASLAQAFAPSLEPQSGEDEDEDGDADADPYLAGSRSSSLPSLNFSSSLISLSEPCSRSCSDDDDDASDWSDFEFDSHYRDMCRPLEAKDLSIATGKYYAVTSLEAEGLVPGDQAVVGDMILQGYNHGHPVYYKFTGIHTDLSAIMTETAYGKRYVRQPVETCFGRCQDHYSESPAVSTETRNLDHRSTETLSTEITGADEHIPETSRAQPTIIKALSNEVFQPEISSSGMQKLESPPNRNFRNEWLEVAKSPLGGYGIFAMKDIKAYSHILLERPFLRTRNGDDLWKKYEKLGREQKLVFDGLHGYSERDNDAVAQKYSANSFGLPGGAGVFAVATNFNHACYTKRTVQYFWDDFRKVMVFTADSDIAQGDELLISYGINRWRLKDKFGFLCTCGGCEGGDVDPKPAARKIKW